MNEEQGGSPGKDEPEASDQQVSWRRFGEFFANILRLERTVARLDQDNRRLRDQVTALQRMVDDHNGQLKLFWRRLTHQLPRASKTPRIARQSMRLCVFWNRATIKTIAMAEHAQ